MRKVSKGRQCWRQTYRLGVVLPVVYGWVHLVVDDSACRCAEQLRVTVSTDGLPMKHGVTAPRELHCQRGPLDSPLAHG